MEEEKKRGKKGERKRESGRKGMEKKYCLAQQGPNWNILEN